MSLEPGELYWEDREGYTYWIVGRASGENFGTFDEEVARAVSDAELKKVNP